MSRTLELGAGATCVRMGSGERHRSFAMGDLLLQIGGARTGRGLNRATVGRQRQRRTRARREGWDSAGFLWKSSRGGRPGIAHEGGWPGEGSLAERRANGASLAALVNSDDVPHVKQIYKCRGPTIRQQAEGGSSRDRPSGPTTASPKRPSPAESRAFLAQSFQFHHLSFSGSGLASSAK